MEKTISPTVRERAVLDCPLALKSLSEEGRFTGYGSVFGVVDTQRDVVERGAFAEAMRQLAPSDIKLLWQHDAREPIGVIEEVYEDAHGLVVKGRLLLEVARAREAYALLKSGAVQGLSIGYTPLRYVLDPDKKVRVLKAVRLYEISLVTFPANPQAQVVTVKSGLSPALQAEIARSYRALAAIAAQQHRRLW